MVEARGSIPAEGRTHISWQLRIGNGVSIEFQESRILIREFPICLLRVSLPVSASCQETSPGHVVSEILRKELYFRTLDQINEKHEHELPSFRVYCCLFCTSIPA
jgi:hypothetical protein